MTAPVIRSIIFLTLLILFGIVLTQQRSDGWSYEPLYHDSYKHLEYGHVLNYLFRNPNFSNRTHPALFDNWEEDMRKQVLEDSIQREWDDKCLAICPKEALQSMDWTRQMKIGQKTKLLLHTANQLDESMVMMPRRQESSDPMIGSSIVWEWVNVWMGLFIEYEGNPSLLDVLDGDDTTSNNLSKLMNDLNAHNVYLFQQTPGKARWYMLGRKWKLSNYETGNFRLEPAQRETSGIPFKVMSYNIHNYEGDWSRRLFKMLKVIERNNPDVICFQEVRLDEYKDVSGEDNSHKGHVLDMQHQLIHIKKALTQLGYIHYVFRPAMSYVSPNSGGKVLLQEEGLAIFSKYPIINSDHFLLYRDLTDHSTHQRICLRARVLIPANNQNGFVTVDLFNTHLSLKEHERNQNVLDINAFSKRVLTESNSFTPSLQIVCGDFNLEPFEPAYSSMIEDGKWQDSYVEQRNSKQTQEETIEFDLQNELTFSTNGVFRKRIDYILYRTHSQVKLTDYLIDGKASEYAHEDSDYKAPSDHHALVSSFIMME